MSSFSIRLRNASASRALCSRQRHDIKAVAQLADKVDASQAAPDAIKPRAPLVGRRAVAVEPGRKQQGKGFAQLLLALHLVTDKLEDHLPPEHARIARENGLFLGLEQPAGPQRFRAARRQEIAEDIRADCVSRRHSRAATETDRLDRGFFGHDRA